MNYSLTIELGDMSKYHLLVSELDKIKFKTHFSDNSEPLPIGQFIIMNTDKDIHSLKKEVIGICDSLGKSYLLYLILIDKDVSPEYKIRRYLN